MKELSFSFEKALPGFHLSMEGEMGREVLVIFGPSGSGKSLLLSMISGIVSPDRGEMILRGRTLFSTSKKISIPPRERRIGAVFQEPALFPHMTVMENVRFGCHTTELLKDVPVLVETFRLKGIEKRYPGDLSGGQKQRVALARALARKPDLLLLDEPLTALDERIKEKLSLDLLRIREILDIPVILVTHNLGEVFALADRIMVMEGGKKIEEGKKEEIFQRPKMRLSARLLGMKNLFPCRVLEMGEKALIQWMGRTLIGLSDRRFSGGDDAVFCINPTSVRLVVAGRKKENLVSARVERITSGPDLCRVFLRVSWTEQHLVMDIPVHAMEKWGVETGRDVVVSLDPSHLFLCQ